jgi:uncharacterized protein YbaP (TraB family)
MMIQARLSALLLAVFGVLTGCGTAQSGDPPPFGQGVLWRVEKAGAVSHVFGTVHSVDERVVNLAPRVADTFAAARNLSIEMIDDQATQSKLTVAMLIPGGRTLEEILGPELFAETVKVGERYGFQPAALERLKPWAPFLFYSYPPSEFHRIAAGMQPLDQRLQHDAEARAIPVYGLETPEEQIATFDEMKESDQVALLAGVVTQNPTIEEQFAAIIEHYVARDVAAIVAMTEAQTGEGDEALMRMFQQRLITDRNHRMADRMAARLEEGGAFVAIGALHLPGEEGVLNLLKQRGFEISRVY